MSVYNGAVKLDIMKTNLLTVSESPQIHRCRLGRVIATTLVSTEKLDVKDDQG